MGKKKEKKHQQEDYFLPSHYSLGNNDIYARGSPLKDKESKNQAS